MDIPEGAEIFWSYMNPEWRNESPRTKKTKDPVCNCNAIAGPHMPTKNKKYVKFGTVILQPE